MEGRDLISWGFFGVITVSLFSLVQPLFVQTEGDLMLWGGLLGVIVGCLALLIWRHLKDRGTKTSHRMSWISLCALVVSAPVFFLSVLVEDTAWASPVLCFGLPFLIMCAGYFVQLGLLMQRALKLTIFGLPAPILLLGAWTEFLLFTVLARFYWWSVLLSMGLGALVAIADIAGMKRLRRSEPKLKSGDALVVVLIMSLMGLVGVALSTPTSRLQLTIQYQLGKRDFRNAKLTWADLRGAYLAEANLSDVNLYGADLGGANLNAVNLYRAYLPHANLSGADLTGADLLGANLNGADLRGAKVTDWQLAQAKSLEGAIMPDGTVHE